MAVGRRSGKLGGSAPYRPLEPVVMKLTTRFMLLLCALLVACPALSATRDEITTALDYYAEIWNEGDFEALRGYYSPDFVLVSARGVETLAQRFDDMNTLAAGGDDRGELSYSDVKVTALADEHALAYGQMRLQFKDGSSIDSWFSTVYAKTPFGWKAILTHQ
jgi:ketosteroid isomerase-like protein